MKKTIILFTAVLFTACAPKTDVTLSKDFVIADNVQQNGDGSFEVSLKTDDAANKNVNMDVHFPSKFRLQAGDTLWSRYQLAEYNINKITAVSMENTALKDTIASLKVRLKNAELESQLLKNYYYSSLDKK